MFHYKLIFLLSICCTTTAYCQVTDSIVLNSCKKKKINIQQIEHHQIYPGLYSYVVNDTLYEISKGVSYYKEKIREKEGGNFYHIYIYMI